ncbi:FAD-dependent oxidoreductase [Coraliomargarita parva]|uniref:FAD-dependent oxidoreductase n=1 Tax=Coraliomargarita parva TaxID=3014050 RepID=UPI0022B4484A|nr:FAD-dependent oxidoreductase [Coraliomargarita parva]
MNPNLNSKHFAADLCVVGGGMAGLVAAVAAARRGASVVLIHDRPVLGGNASSEVRMWICGALGYHRKETGILEEIMLLNMKRNPGGCYSVWDSVLYEFAAMTPGLTTLLNCSCNDLEMEGSRITKVNAWQLTTQTWHTIEASYFIDCSGDSILAPLSGADVVVGRESREATGEPIAPLKADLKTMGNSILLQLEETAEAQPFTPPEWAYQFDDASNLPSRIGSGFGQNFWWLEIGGLQNTIDDAEAIYDELVKAAWGVWDYMKNRGPQAEKLKNWRLKWMGSLPGKRENRRYVGPHMLTQMDLESEGQFEDIVAYGGWKMDDHHPAGLYYPGAATIFHPCPSPYGIPLRSLYSRNVENLFCAGRNISATHVALSSTRVMGTCAIMGQAVGTAAALCTQLGLMPAELSKENIQTVQWHLMEDDCWLPDLPRRSSGLTQNGTCTTSDGSDATVLMDGHERDADHGKHYWSAAVGSSVELAWNQPETVECLRLVFDSDLTLRKRMPSQYGFDEPKLKVPNSMVKAFTVEVLTESGEWEVLRKEEANARRLWVLAVGKAVCGIRWTGHATWGGDNELRLYSMEALDTVLPLTFSPSEGASWSSVCARIPAKDMAAPDHGLEKKSETLVGA